MTASSRPGPRPDRLILTCEHAGHRIPREHAPLFRGAAALLASHRGWDPGALAVARHLARAGGVPLRAVTWSRLLVEANRAPANPRIWSQFTKSLPADERACILDRYWWPHRREVETMVQEHATAGARVVHVAVHSFTGVLGHEVRNADIGLLYDPARPGEAALCRRWQEALHAVDPGLRVRRNYPYRGVADGLPTWLRRRFGEDAYAGVELELNQQLLTGAGLRRMKRSLAASLEQLLGFTAARATGGGRTRTR